MPDGREDDPLREFDARFRLAVETLGEGVVITDAEDRIVYVNSRMAQISGHQREAMVGENVVDLLVPEEDRAGYAERMALRMQGVSEQYEVSFRKKDGERFWAAVNGSPLTDSAGRIVEGDPNSIRRQRDVWTFARSMGEDDPNWLLVATGG